MRDLVRIEPGSVVVTVASTASGHEEWAARNFTPDQFVTLDECRRLVAGNELDRAATAEAFELLVRAVDGRARRGVTTAVAGAFFDPTLRRRLAELARRHGRPAVAVCFRLPEELAQFRNRTGRVYTPAKLLERQLEQVEEFVREGGADEGWDRVLVFDDVDPDLAPVVR